MYGSGGACLTGAYLMRLDPQKPGELVETNVDTMFPEPASGTTSRA